MLPQAEAEFEERSRKSVVGVRTANALLISAAPCDFRTVRAAGRRQDFTGARAPNHHRRLPEILNANRYPLPLWKFVKPRPQNPK